MPVYMSVSWIYRGKGTGTVCNVKEEDVVRVQYDALGGGFNVAVLW